MNLMVVMFKLHVCMFYLCMYDYACVINLAKSKIIKSCVNLLSLAEQK